MRHVCLRSPQYPKITHLRTVIVPRRHDGFVAPVESYVGVEAARNPARGTGAASHFYKDLACRAAPFPPPPDLARMCSLLSPPTSRRYNVVQRPDVRRTPCNVRRKGKGTEQKTEQTAAFMKHARREIDRSSFHELCFLSQYRKQTLA